jgi:hypothetical protein
MTREIRRVPGFALAAFCAMAGWAGAASAATSTLGTITVCYYSPKCAFAANAVGSSAKLRMAQAIRDSGEHQGGIANPLTKSYPPVDAPAFEIVNTGTESITGAKLTMLADTAENVPMDTYAIGAIAPGKHKVIVPGSSNDKKTHPANGIFFFRGLGDPLDTSDSVPNANAVTFVFTGKLGSQVVSSGNIVVGNFVKPSADGTVSAINFLGGPGNADGPCNDCVDPEQVGTISASTNSVVDTAK